MSGALVLLALEGTPVGPAADPFQRSRRALAAAYAPPPAPPSASTGADDSSEAGTQVRWVLAAAEGSGTSRFHPQSARAARRFAVAISVVVAAACAFALFATVASGGLGSAARAGSGASALLAAGAALGQLQWMHLLSFVPVRMPEAYGAFLATLRWSNLFVVWDYRIDGSLRGVEPSEAPGALPIEYVATACATYAVPPLQRLQAYPGVYSALAASRGAGGGVVSAETFLLSNLLTVLPLLLLALALPQAWRRLAPQAAAPPPPGASSLALGLAVVRLALRGLTLASLILLLNGFCDGGYAVAIALALLVGPGALLAAESLILVVFASAWPLRSWRRFKLAPSTRAQLERLEGRAQMLALNLGPARGLWHRVRTLADNAFSGCSSIGLSSKFATTEGDWLPVDASARAPAADGGAPPARSPDETAEALRARLGLALHARSGGAALFFAPSEVLLEVLRVMVIVLIPQRPNLSRAAPALQAGLLLGMEALVLVSAVFVRPFNEHRANTGRTLVALSRLLHLAILFGGGDPFRTATAAGAVQVLALFALVLHALRVGAWELSAGRRLRQWEVKATVEIEADALALNTRALAKGGSALPPPVARAVIATVLRACLDSYPVAVGLVRQVVHAEYVRAFREGDDAHPGSAHPGALPSGRLGRFLCASAFPRKWRFDADAAAVARAHGTACSKMVELLCKTSIVVWGSLAEGALQYIILEPRRTLLGAAETVAAYENVAAAIRALVDDEIYDSIELNASLRGFGTEASKAMAAALTPLVLRVLDEAVCADSLAIVGEVMPPDDLLDESARLPLSWEWATAHEEDLLEWTVGAGAGHGSPGRDAVQSAAKRISDAARLSGTRARAPAAAVPSVAVARA
jgi:hypothetical protein